MSNINKMLDMARAMEKLKDPLGINNTVLKEITKRDAMAKNIGKAVSTLGITREAIHPKIASLKLFSNTGMQHPNVLALKAQRDKLKFPFGEIIEMQRQRTTFANTHNTVSPVQQLISDTQKQKAMFAGMQEVGNPIQQLMRDTQKQRTMFAGMQEVSNPIQQLMRDTQKQKNMLAGMREFGSPIQQVMRDAQKQKTMFDGMREFGSPIQQVMRDAQKQKAMFADMREIGNPVQQLIRDAQKQYKTFTSTLGVSSQIIKNIQIPDTVLTGMRNIGMQQVRFNANIAAVGMQHFTGMRNVQMTLGQVMHKTTNSYIKSGQWDLLEEFEQVNEDLANISEQIAQAGEITITELNALWEKLKAVLNRAIVFYKAHRTGINEIVGLLGLILGIIGYQSSKSSATKDDIVSMHKEMQQHVVDTVKVTSEYRLVRMACNAKLTKKGRTVIETLGKGVPVKVLRTEHKWAYISFTSPDDSLIHSGWILKKYLGCTVHY